MARIYLEPVSEDTPPETLVDIFNSNRDFLEASGERYPYSADDVAMYLYEETNRENSRCLLIRLADNGEVIGTAALAAPLERAGCPWIGLLLLHDARQGQGIGAEAAALLAEMLAAEGWPEIRLSVLRANLRARRFWERQGYRVTGEREDQDRRGVWVMSKTLGDQASGSAT
jgi:RimJ/RimL family protein N-acetyltransferase